MMSMTLVKVTVWGCPASFCSGLTKVTVTRTAVTSVQSVAVSSTGGVNSFYQAPVAYIGELGEDATVANATDYVIDAWSYGGSQSTVAVVESVYQIIRPVASATSP